MNLYEIANAIQDISEMVDEDGVLLPEAEKALDELQMTQTEKFKNLWALIKNLSSNAEMIKAEKQRLAAKQSALENKVDRLKAYLKFIMEKSNMNKFEAWIFSFSLRNFSSVVVANIDSLPEEYKKITTEAKKTELAAALKEWKTIEWVSIATNKSIIIK